MKSKKTILFSVVLTILVGVSLFILLYYKPFNTTKPTEPKPVEVIKEFNYELEDRDTELYKTEYYILKDVLSKEEVDYNEYAKQVAKLYIIDLYTIDNKKNKYDVGSLEFVYPEVKDNFELKVKDTIYKYVENDTGKREQKLPKVKSIQINEFKENSVTFKEKMLPCYDIKLNWDYIVDLGYDKEAELILIRQENIIYVLEQK